MRAWLKGGLIFTFYGIILSMIDRFFGGDGYAMYYFDFPVMISSHFLAKSIPFFSFSYGWFILFHIINFIIGAIIGFLIGWIIRKRKNYK